MERDLMGLAELAQMLRVSRPRARQIADSATFPSPVARLAAGPVWERSDVEQWARETGRIAD